MLFHSSKYRALLIQSAQAGAWVGIPILLSRSCCFAKIIAIFWASTSGAVWLRDGASAALSSDLKSHDFYDAGTINR